MSSRVNRRGLARRQAILDAAIELWARKGWRATGLAAVAEHAGVGRAGLLYHFGTKENLLIEVIAEHDRRNVDRLASVFTDSGLGVLRTLLLEVGRLNEEQPGLAALNLVLQVESIDPDGPAHAYYVARQHFLRDVFTELIETGQKRGEIRPDVDPTFTTMQIISFMEGAEVQRHFQSDVIDILSLYEDFTARLIRDLTTSQP